jgi:hypothetical protein
VLKALEQCVERELLALVGHLDPVFKDGHRGAPPRLPMDEHSRAVQRYAR